MDADPGALEKSVVYRVLALLAGRERAGRDRQTGVLSRFGSVVEFVEAEFHSKQRQRGGRREDFLGSGCCSFPIVSIELLCRQMVLDELSAFTARGHGCRADWKDKARAVRG